VKVAAALVELNYIITHDMNRESLRLAQCMCKQPRLSPVTGIHTSQVFTSANTGDNLVLVIGQENAF
jgi:hypothetical protein